MKSSLKNTPLMIAITLSVLVHSALLMVHFVKLDEFRLQPDPGLEIVLVDAKQDKKPLQADALAQANLDGSSTTDGKKLKSPLPDSQIVEDGAIIRNSQHRISELEQEQKQLLAQIKSNVPDNKNQLQQNQSKQLPASDNPAPMPTNNHQAVSRMAAEIAQTIDDQSKRPRKTFITLSTQEVGYAMYYKALQKRIEEIGTLNFPQQDGKKLYGKLMIYIPIFQDGTIYKKDGGARIEVSSGNPALDQAALRIVQRAAPFGRFPASMRSTDKDDLWIVVTRFDFTREQGLETGLR